jgi:CDP-6-deoxy-D-xylo-4-hexulose-3-dehydrase
MPRIFIGTRLLFGENMLRQPRYQGIRHRFVGVRRTMDNVMELVFWVGLLPGLTEELSELNGAQHEKTSADQQS